MARGTGATVPRGARPGSDNRRTGNRPTSTGPSADLRSEEEHDVGHTHLRARLNTALFDLHSPIGRRLNLLGMVVIALTVALSMIGTLGRVPAGWRSAIQMVEIGVSAAFAIE